MMLVAGILIAGALYVSAVSDSDIANIAKKLIDADVNRAKPGQVYVNYQGYTRSTSDDRASQPFFKRVDDSLLETPTAKAFLALFDNYDRDTGVAEDNTAQEAGEVDAFLDAVLATDVMQELEAFLSQKGYSEGKDLRAALKKIWFDNYSRARGRKDTSGFEHVFLGEYKRGVSGLHNWIRLYMLEKNGEADYKGYVLKRSMSNGNPLFSLIRYTWDKESKSTGSLLIGTSPEFDLGIFSLCFITRAGKPCRFTFDNLKMEVITHSIVQDGKTYVGSAYPSLPR